MHKIFLPRLGQTMEEGMLLQWLSEVGTDHDAGDDLYELETEKVTVEVQANLPGRLLRLLVEPGQHVEVGTLLAVAADPGEEVADGDVDRYLADAGVVLDGAPASAQDGDAGPAGGGDAVPDASAAASPPQRLRGLPTAMPRTRAMAKRAGLELADITGTGPQGLITEQDVEQAVSAAQASAAPAAGAPPTPTPSSTPAPRAARPASEPAAVSTASGGGPAVRERRPLRPVHRRMAEVVARSWTQVPQFTQTVTVDATVWKARRAALREKGTAVSMTDVLLDALVQGVREVPEVNVKFDGDAVLIYEDVNVSIAVDTPDGLQVPVVRGAQRMDLPTRAQRLKDITDRAREGRLAPDDVSAGTITMSNLGMQGIEGGVPLVTAPQVAIVFVGAIRNQVVPSPDRNGMEVRPQCVLSIGYDHRAVDGATAARFTSGLRRILEEER